MEYTKALRDLVIQDRHDKKLTQAQYGALCGVSQSIIAKIEKGDTENIGIGIVMGIAKTAGKSLDEIFGQTARMSINAENFRMGRKRLNDLAKQKRILHNDVLEKQTQIDEINREVASILQYMEENK